MSGRFASKDYWYTVTEAEAHILKDSSKQKSRPPQEKEGRGTDVCPVCLGYCCGPNPYGRGHNKGPQKGATSHNSGMESQRDQYGREVIG